MSSSGFHIPYSICNVNLTIETVKRMSIPEIRITTLPIAGDTYNSTYIQKYYTFMI